MPVQMKVMVASNVYLISDLEEVGSYFWQSKALALLLKNYKLC
jgi:hypothetical protein